PLGARADALAIGATEWVGQAGLGRGLQRRHRAVEAGVFHPGDEARACTSCHAVAAQQQGAQQQGPAVWPEGVAHAVSSSFPWPMMPALLTGAAALDKRLRLRL